MIAGTFVQVQPQHGAYLVTWSRGEGLQHAAFADLDQALGFGEAFIGKPLDEVTTHNAHSYWLAVA